MRCKYCQSRLVAYIHNELPLKQRREVAQHLDTCETCYAVYLQQQDLVHELTVAVPRVGAGSHKADFKAVWMAMHNRAEHTKSSSSSYSVRYGLAALVVTLLFLIPLTMGGHNITLAAPPTQPAPLTLRATPSSTASNVGAAIVALHVGIEVTPEAEQQIGSPSLDLANTP